MRAERLLSQHSLANGLTLEFWDLSRPVLGDRWQVVVEARLAIPVNADNLPLELKDQASRVSAVLGAEMVFTKQEGRYFIPMAKVEDTVRTIEAALVASLSRYLGHPEFPVKFLRNKWRAIQENSPGGRS
jgi:hypothetical protein